MSRDYSDILEGLEPVGDDTGTDDGFESVFNSIVQQESGGNYAAVGAPTKYGRALGRYQVIPPKIREWSRKHVGREVSRTEFLNTPELQDQIARGAMREYYADALAKSGGDRETAAKRTAAAWYSGNPDNYRSTAPQTAGGKRFPSIAEYAGSVAKRAGAGGTGYDDIISDLKGPSFGGRTAAQVDPSNLQWSDPWKEAGPRGRIEAGNVDLTKRPVVRNPDGTISTVRSMSINEDGREILIPTVSDDGRVVSDDEAVKLYHASGKHLGKFDSPDAATEYAKSLHDQQAAAYGNAPRPQIQFGPDAVLNGRPLSRGAELVPEPASPAETPSPNLLARATQRRRVPGVRGNRRAPARDTIDAYARMIRNMPIFRGPEHAPLGGEVGRFFAPRANVPVEGEAVRAARDVTKMRRPLETGPAARLTRAERGLAPAADPRAMRPDIGSSTAEIGPLGTPVPAAPIPRSYMGPREGGFSQVGTRLGQALDAKLARAGTWQGVWDAMNPVSVVGDVARAVTDPGVIQGVEEATGINVRDIAPQADAAYNVGSGLVSGGTFGMVDAGTIDRATLNPAIQGIVPIAEREADGARQQLGGSLVGGYGGAAGAGAVVNRVLNPTMLRQVVPGLGKLAERAPGIARRVEEGIQGATLGAGMRAARRPGEDETLGQRTLSIGAGAIGVGLGNTIAPGNPLGMAVGNVGGSAVERSITGEAYTPDDIALDTAMGLAPGLKGVTDVSVTPRGEYRADAAARAAEPTRRSAIRDTAKVITALKPGERVTFLDESGETRFATVKGIEGRSITLADSQGRTTTWDPRTAAARRLVPGVVAEVAAVEAQRTVRDRQRLSQPDRIVLRPDQVESARMAVGLGTDAPPVTAKTLDIPPVRIPTTPVETPVAVDNLADTSRVDGTPESGQVASDVATKSKNVDTGPRPWEMSRDDLEQSATEGRQAEESILTDVFGVDGAREYRRLDRIERGDSTHAQGMEAVRAMRAMEDALTPEQRARLDSIPDWRATSDYANAARSFDDSSPEAMGRSLAGAVRDLATVKDASDPSTMDQRPLSAYIAMKNAMEHAESQGWDLQAIGRTALKEAGAGYSDPADAAFMLDRWFKPSKTTAPKAELAPPIVEKRGPDRLTEDQFNALPDSEKWHLRNTDTLTGLRNQTWFEAAHKLADADPELGVAVFDGDNFGWVNKAEGQEAGDKALQRLGAALKQAADEAGVVETPKTGVARAGGDEFYVLAPKALLAKIRARAEELAGIEPVTGVEPGTPFKRTKPVGLTGSIGDTRADAEASLQEFKAAKKGQREFVEDAPIDQIVADPERFQFRRGFNEKGGTGRLEGRKYNRKYVGTLTVWTDPADGQVYVINGHHRLEKAMEAGETTVPVRFLPPEVKTADQALKEGALENLSQGNVTATDAAMFLRKSGYPLDKALEELAGASDASSSVVKRAVELSKLDENVFGRVMDGTLSESQGVAIGKHLADPDLQTQAMRILAAENAKGRTLKDSHVNELVESMKHGPAVESVTSTLFGDQTESRSLVVERAGVSDYIKSEIAADKRAFGGAARNKERLEGGGSKIDEAKAREIAESATTALELFDKEKRVSGRISEVLDDAARQIAEGKPARQVRADAYSRIRPLLDEVLAGGSRDADAGSERGTGAGGRVPEEPGLFGEPVAESTAPASSEGNAQYQREAPFPTEQSAPKTNANGRIQAAPITGGRVKNVSAIIKDLEKGLGARIRVTKGLPAKAAGAYYPGSGRINMRRANNLDTAAHEASHWLDDAHGIVRQWAQDTAPSPYDAELIPRFSRTGSTPPDNHPNPLVYTRAEGVAEWVRAYVMDPDSARAAAPKFAAYFETAVPPRTRAVLDRFSKDVRELAGLTPTERVEANVRHDLKGKTRVEKLTERARERFTTAWIDSRQPILRGIDEAMEMREIAKLKPGEDPKMLIARLAGINTRIGNMLENGLVDAKENRVTKGLDEQVFRHLDTTDESTLRQGLKDMSTLGLSEIVLERAQNLQLDVAAKVDVRAERLNERFTKDEARIRTTAEDLKRQITERYDAALALQRERLETRAQYRSGLDTGRTEGSAAARAKAAREKYAGRGPMLEKGVASRILNAAERRIVKSEGQRYTRQTVDDAKLTQEIERRRDAALARLDARVDKRIADMDRALTERIRGMHERASAAAFQRSSQSSGVGAALGESDVIAHRKAIAHLKSDPERYARAEKAIAGLREWSDATLKYARDKGLISAKSYAEIRERNEYYTAMQRVIDETEGVTARRGRGGRALGSSSGKVVERWKGSTREIESPIIATLEQTARIIKEADRNEAIGAFTKLLETERGMYDGKQLPLDLVGSLAARGDKNTVRVVKNGEEQFWQFDEPIYEALKGLGDQSAMPGWIRAPGSILRAGVTYSPPFVVRNLIRDSFNRALISNVGSKPWDTLRGYTPAERSEAELAGLGQFGHYMSDAEAYHAYLDDRINHLRQDKSTILMGAKDVASGYGKLSEKSELVGRMAEYKRAKRKALAEGMSEQDARIYAVNEARGLLDFAVAGNYMRQINQIVPFSNAAVQGLRRTVRTAKTPKGAAALAAKSVAYVILPQIAAYAFNAAQGPEVEEEYWQLPAWQRDMFWNFKVPAETGSGGDRWLRIPKPFEIGVIASGFDRSIAHARGDKHAFEGYAGSLAKSLMPIDAESVLVPAAARGAVEVGANYSFFRDDNIVSPWENELDLELRKNTDRASRVGMLIQDSAYQTTDARKADHFIRAQGGGVAGLALDASDLGRSDKPRATERFAENAAGVFSDSPAYSARDVKFVLETAEARGEGQSKTLKPLKDLLRKYSESSDANERDNLARQAREMAGRMRTGYETTKTFK